jgi:beta-glucuronidase
MLLEPQQNAFRQLLDLAGIWELRFDSADLGREQGWIHGFDHSQPLAVPASWNEQVADALTNLGPAWYQTQFTLPWGWETRQIALRFASVNYLAEVWLNGVELGQHVGGHVPFAFEVTPHLQPGLNRIVVRVDGRLNPHQVPVGGSGQNYERWDPPRQYPDVSFDYFPYCGIQRTVQLVATPVGGLDDLTVMTDLDGEVGIVQVKLQRSATTPVTAHLRLHGHGSDTNASSDFTTDTTLTLRVPQAALWSPQTPNLYQLTVELTQNNQPFDSYSLAVGIRTITVVGDQLLLNGEPLELRGFGRHEDFPVVGRGFVPAVAIKDLALMEWCGANSFRTTHYPYAEETLKLADQLGFLVIDEIPAVGLIFNDLPEAIAERLRLCRQMIGEMIARDKNHPSVIAWCIANEPRSHQPTAVTFFRELYELCKTLDPTRPATVVSDLGVHEESFAFLDLVCVNRYYGWYTEQGQLDAAQRRLSEELDLLHTTFGKPLLLSEFGADAIAGMHAQPPEMWTEEYQAEMIRRYLAVVRSKPYIVGQHIWNLCDFKTGQGVMRAGAVNHKGIFTRDRRPKLAAHVVRELWLGQGSGSN